MSASYRKSTQVHARPGQTESQVDPSFQLASTCESVWPDFTEDNAQIQNEMIWNNSNILNILNKNTIFFKQWYQNGIIRLQGLLDFDYTFLSLQTFQHLILI